MFKYVVDVQALLRGKYHKIFSSRIMHMTQLSSNLRQKK